MHRLERRVTGLLGCGPRVLAGDPGRLTGFPQLLALLPDKLERLAMLIAHDPRFLGEPPESFRLVSCGLGREEKRTLRHTGPLCLSVRSLSTRRSSIPHYARRRHAV